jgi:hypothetical protein
VVDILVALVGLVDGDQLLLLDTIFDLFASLRERLQRRLQWWVLEQTFLFGAMRLMTRLDEAYGAVVNRRWVLLQTD